MKNNIIKQLVFSVFMGFLIGSILIPGLVFDMANPNIYRLDAAEHYFGWLFYKNSPWLWPVTYTNWIQYPNQTSIVYVDGFPILSVLFKSISGLLPDFIGFHGIAVIINFSLMFFVIYRAIVIKTGDILYAFLSGCIACISTPYLFRMQYHAALSNHWIIVLCFYPYVFNFKRFNLFYAAIIFIALGVHAYLALMCMFIILVYYVHGFLWRKIGLRSIIFDGLIYFFAFIASYYLFGYQGGYSVGGGDLLGANLLDFIVPIRGYSSLVNSVALHRDGGWAYFGLGLFSLIFLTVLVTAVRCNGNFIKISVLWVRCNYVLLLSLVMLFVISLSSKWHFGMTVLYDFPIREKLISYLSVFRAVERFNWVIYYAVLFSVLIQLYRSGFSSRVKNCILIMVIVVQAVEFKPLFASLNKEYSPSLFNYGYNYDKYWFELRPAGYKNLYLDPVFVDQFRNDRYGNSILYTFAYIAAYNKLTLNNYYLARRNVSNDKYLSDSLTDVVNFKFEDGAIYVLDRGRIGFLESDSCRYLDEYIVCSKMF